MVNGLHTEIYNINSENIKITYDKTHLLTQLIENAKINICIDIECMKYKVFEREIENTWCNKIECWLSGTTISEANKNLKLRNFNALPGFIFN